jgi:hypothetical protein
MNIDIKQLNFIHVKLRAILTFLEIATGLQFTITSLYRIGDRGVHGQLPLRGVDLRIRSRSFGKIIVKLINKTWKYNSSRPKLKCAILHGKGSNMHIHLQVHDKTMRY